MVQQFRPSISGWTKLIEAVSKNYEYDIQYFDIDMNWLKKAEVYYQDDEEEYRKVQWYYHLNQGGRHLVYVDQNLVPACWPMTNRSRVSQWLELRLLLDTAVRGAPR